MAGAAEPGRFGGAAGAVAGAAAGAVACDSAACGACAPAAAGVIAAAARAIAHPINFIVTPIDSVAKDGPPVSGRPKIRGLIGGTFRSLKRSFGMHSTTGCEGGLTSLFRARQPERTERDRRRNFGGIPRRRRAAGGPFHPVFGPSQPPLPAMCPGADGRREGGTAGPRAGGEDPRRASRIHRRSRFPGDGRRHHRP